MARRVDIPEGQAAAIREQRAALNEVQGRQFLGRVSISIGRGGDAAVAGAAGVDPRTVARGRREVEAGMSWSPGDRVRAPGAGRPSIEGSFLRATGLDLREIVGAIARASSYGDPSVETRLAHTNATAAKIAAEIERMHAFRMGETATRKVVRACGYTQQKNRKIEQVGKRHPKRDEQFEYKEEVLADFEARGLPIVSCDTKAKIKLGQFAAGGQELRLKGDARRAEDHDFAKKWGEIYADGHPEIDEGRMGANAVLAPYGVYDVGENAAHVTLGTSSDTSEFATGSLGRWWAASGREAHPGATEILLLLDGGGSNRAAGYLYKYELAVVCGLMGLEAVTVFHFPPGTSRYNPVERHLWSPMSRSVSGKPMGTAEEAALYVEATTTGKGLKVSCEVDWGVYLTEAAKERARKDAGEPKGKTAGQRFFEIADIEHFHEDATMQKWNYRIVLKGGQAA